LDKPSLRHFRLESNAEGVATLWLDVENKTVNVLNQAVLHELELAIRAAADDSQIRVLILQSAKESGFFAGADLKAFTDIRTAEEAEALSLFGQGVFQLLADLKAVTIAVIHGPCLGGGLELALACDYRLAVDQPGTQLGLPEVELGIIPGWGGTQRLPQTIPVENALPMILAAKNLDARQSSAIGLVDRAVSPTELSLAVNELTARCLLLAAKPRRRPRRSMRQWLLEANPLGRRLLFHLTRRQLAERVPDDMPAPWEALRAVEIGLAQGPGEGLSYERKANGKLFTESPASRNLINLFFLREQARKLPTAAADSSLARGESGRPIRRVGVVGAGVMGAGIAQLAAIKGMEVVIQDVSDAAVAAGAKRIEELYEQAVDRKIVTAEEAKRQLSSIAKTIHWEGFETADLVVEAVTENLSAKQAVFRELECRIPATALMATNTSSLLVGQLQEGLSHPERLAAAHFFNPVHKMPLVELASAPQTATAIVTALRQWVVQIGKTPVVVKDSPGFLVNRILLPYFHETLLILLVDGIPTEKIDRVMRHFGMPMGPLELLDQIGLDVALHICETLNPHFGDRFAQAGPMLDDLVKAGFLGKKNGRGFYLYDTSKPRPNPEVMKTAGIQVELYQPIYPRSDGIRDRLAAVMVNEAARCLEERIAPDAATIDLAMILGTGWAPHRGGPVRYADDVGVARFVEKMMILRQEWGSRFLPCEELRRRAEAKEPFYGTLQ
jgi:3-hydroxyacyl-CoA dehydrogenase / enoyl-CoA hydratase / 3-hydroxybutyryl-CoA epimerase